METMRKKNPTAIRFTPKARELLEGLAEHLGVTKTAVMEMAIRKLAQKEGIQGKDEKTIH